MDKRKILIVSAAVLGTIILLSAFSLSSSGLLTKAFTRSVLPGDVVEEALHNKSA